MALHWFCSRHFPAKHKLAFYGQTYFDVHTALGSADASHSLSRKLFLCVCVCACMLSLWLDFGQQVLEKNDGSLSVFFFFSFWNIGWFSLSKIPTKCCWVDTHLLQPLNPSTPSITHYWFNSVSIGKTEIVVSEIVFSYSHSIGSHRYKQVSPSFSGTQPHMCWLSKRARSAPYIPPLAMLSPMYYLCTYTLYITAVLRTARQGARE